MTFKSLSFYLVVILLALQACDSSDGPKTDNYDRASLVTNLSDNIIVPRYAALNTSVNQLKTDIDAFIANPTLTTHGTALATFNQTYKNWQACSTFEFGPASTQTLRGSINTYPIDVTQINNNINSQNYNLETASNIDAKGLPALDYLLAGVGNDAQGVVDFYKTADSTKRKTYLNDIITNVQTKVNTVNTAWTTYQTEFKALTGTDAGSALGMLVNAINFDYEKYIRDGKIGIPAGVRSLGTPQPNSCEALYTQQSLALATEAITKLQELYNGGTGIGLDDYLNYLNAQHNNEPLNTKILNQFSAIKTALNNLNAPLSAEVTNNTQQVKAAYQEMQKMVVYLKVDLSSSIGILITYADNDGD